MSISPLTISFSPLSPFIWRRVGPSWTVLWHAPLQLWAQPQSVSKDCFTQALQQREVKTKIRQHPLKLNFYIKTLTGVLTCVDARLKICCCFSLQELLHSSRKLSLKVLSFVQSFQVKSLCRFFGCPLKKSCSKVKVLPSEKSKYQVGNNLSIYFDKLFKPIPIATVCIYKASQTDIPFKCPVKTRATWSLWDRNKYYSCNSKIQCGKNINMSF